MGVQAKLDIEAAIDKLTAETKRVMIAAGRSYLQSKIEEPNSCNTPQIANEVANTLFPTTKTQLGQGSLPQEQLPTTPPMTIDVQRGATWHAKSAWKAHVTRLGPLMNHLTEFRNLDARFESLGTYVELRDKFGNI